MNYKDDLSNSNYRGQNSGINSDEQNLEAQNRTGKNFEDPDANTPVRILTASSIIGDEVENRSGENLGEIKDLMVNLKSGNIEYAILKFGDFLGIGGKLFAIPFQDLQIDPEKENFILNRSKENFKNAPGFDKEHWPETNSQYFQETTKYWTGIGMIPSGSTRI